MFLAKTGRIAVILVAGIVGEARGIHCDDGAAPYCFL